MRESVHRFFAEDHRRLEALLDASSSNPAAIDQEAFSRFRSGILKHIGWEERILLPTLRRKTANATVPGAEQITLDHGAIAALMVPPPVHSLVNAIRSILKGHNRLEEDPGGLYALCDGLPASDVDEIMRRVRQSPDVPLQPHNPDPSVLGVTRRALRRAGYDLDDYMR